MSHKRIVLDFDDTLAFTTNRDFNNATPNIELIAKTNQLYNEGWQIDIFTARGSLSCKTRKEAKEKYGFQIEQWLLDYGVKYHSLSFDKPLAAYYIDDKGISPEQFLKTDIKNLDGLSGADIYTDGKLVHKTDARAHDVVEWFKVVSEHGVNVPKTQRVVGETITMEYVEHDEDYFKNNTYKGLALIQENLEKFKSIKIKKKTSFFDYIQRIKSHVDICDDLKENIYLDLIDVGELNESFSHGDFGVKNMLFDKDKLTLIDPIPEVFGCTELDIAKFIASLYINGYKNDDILLSKRVLMCYNNINENDINILIRSELARVVKYHPNKEFVIGLIHNVH